MTDEDVKSVTWRNGRIWFFFLRELRFRESSWTAIVKTQDSRHTARMGFILSTFILNSSSVSLLTIRSSCAVTIRFIFGCGSTQER